MNITDQNDEILWDLLKTASITSIQPVAGSIKLSMPAPVVGMKKEDITLDMRVQVQGYGKGTVTDLMPESKFYVKVKYDLDASPKCRGQEMSAEIAKMKPQQKPKPTLQEKSYAKWGAIVGSPQSYYIAGVATKGPAKFSFSAPPKDEEKARTYLDAHHVDDSPLTVSTEATQGSTYTIVMPKFDSSDEYESLTGVHSSPYQRGSQITISAKEFVVEFLCSVLKFDPKLKRQSIATIRANVPKEFQSEFDRGTA